MKTFTCAHCNETVQRRRLRKYCSVRCHGDAMRAANLPNRRRCPECNERVPPKSRNKYCSRKCASLGAQQEGYWGKPKWDETFRLRVKELWGTGMTTVAIGLAMVPQVSKNVIISLARRMGLPERPSPIRRSGPRPECKHERRVNQWTPRRVQTLPMFDVASLFGVEVARKPPAPQKRELPRQQVPTSPHKTCQYPISEAKPYLWCGEATYPGRPYCEAHCRVCYSPWPPVRRDLLEIAA